MLELNDSSCCIDPEIYLNHLKARRTIRAFTDTTVSAEQINMILDAGTVIAVSSDSPQAALIAAAHMETMVYSLGLGMIYSGFTTRAIEQSEELQNYLGLKEGYKVWAVMAIGYPKVKYQRTVPRKKAEVLWD